jgi:hypothetical protein
LTIWLAAIAIPWNVLGFHIHVFQGLIMHEIFH